jgi:hypothetical protein
MINRLIEKILRRKLAYRRTFMTEQGELGPEARVVIDDLRRFCRATGSTAVISPVSKTIDPLAMAMAEGRREVFNRIMAHLYVNERQVFELNEGERDG